MISAEQDWQNFKLELDRGNLDSVEKKIFLRGWNSGYIACQVIEKNKRNNIEDDLRQVVKDVKMLKEWKNASNP